MRTLQDLQEKQALPLSLKIRLTQARIRQWINEFGEEGVYVSFSGGKDSTVLLDLVRKNYPNVPAVFVDTGLEYPEIREFVKTFDNVTWLKPKMGFRKVIETYGYPFISKEVSEKVYYAQRYLEWFLSGKNGAEPTKYSINELCGVPRAERKQHELSESDINAIFSAKGNAPFKAKALFGQVIHKEKGIATNEMSMVYDFSRYKWLITSPFKISSHCCSVMKKAPFKKYAKQTGRVPITAQMASESRLRTSNWIKHGCNAFDAKKKISNPMSFWTEQDVLLYIKQNNLPICSVYGDIVEDEEIIGQMNITDFGMNPVQKINLKTTGCSRTGCMFCGYGCHLEKEGEGRFERMKITHPKQYEWIMKPWDEGGLGYKDVIDWINEHGNLNIRY